MKPLVRSLPTWCKANSFACPVTLRLGLPQTRKSMTDYKGDLVKRLYIHHLAHEHLKLTSDQMKACYNQLANSAGFQERDSVWLYCPTWKRGRSPKLQTY